ncbi:hypothetical protein [Streptomyces sp. NPDC053367]|uniref:hypothetical protein n=1 Tax=Streptomyces sp. NPDC053367 TaxID=3365700 RepID=UPI0037D6080F
MRHPPRSALLHAGSTVTARSGTAAVPVVTASAAVPADPAGDLTALRHACGSNSFADQSCWGMRGSRPALITGYDGTPTSFGIGLHDRLRGLSP